jgi:hypothetical protein
VLLQGREDGLGAQEPAPQAHVEDLVVILTGYLGKTASLRHARVVDEHRHRAELVSYFSHGAAHAGLVAHVALRSHVVAGQLCRQAGHPGRIYVEHADLGTGVGQGLGDGPAYTSPRARSGHYGSAAVKA